MTKFGFGQAVPRSEDPRFLTGRGRYTDDFSIPGAAHAFLVRSPHAHAAIDRIEDGRAAKAPGILNVYTGADLAADGIGMLPCETSVVQKDGAPIKVPPRPALAQGRVRHVGEPVAVIIAETLDLARDAAEAVEIDYTPLPSVTDLGRALDPGLEPIWAEAPGNLCLDWEKGNADAVDAAFAEAASVVEVDLVNNRVIANPIEPRGAIGAFDSESGRMSLICTSQGAHTIRRLLTQDVFDIPLESLHVITPDVGGAFGMKLFLYPEYVLVLYAARRLGRPVRWIGERTESFLSDDHGRDNITHAEMALDEDAHFLALKVSTVANFGAYLSNFAPFVMTESASATLTGPYRTPAIYHSVKGVFTNTNPVDAYRGAGRPETVYMLERLVDAAAAQLGLNPIEIRRRNLVSADSMPYKTPLGETYDVGDFAHTLDQSLADAGYEEFAARQAEARKRGRLRGLGISAYVEACAGGGPMDAYVEIAADGGATVLLGSQSGGQGHETAYKQIVAEGLRLDFDDITFIQGDTDRIPVGSGTGGSRSLPVGGSALTRAVEQIVEKATVAAAEMLEAAPVDIALAEGAFTVVGTDRRIAWAEVASAKAPPDGGPSFEEHGQWQPQSATFPNGTHLCEVEIDPETGMVEVVRYTVVDDFGRILNPELAAGQVLGGIVQGIGQALIENCVYDSKTGQLVTGSLMDYALPRATDTSSIDISFFELPCKTNAIGIKGAGEAGAVASAPAIINAVLDALSGIGVSQIDMPATSEKIWRLVKIAAQTPR